jgi:CheY-like chemotaxis protein
VESSSRPRVLIVDDEDAIRFALRRTLRGEGYDLLFAAHPLEAIPLLESGPVDLIISDNIMPNLSGVEFLRLAREHFPLALRMMLTGDLEAEPAFAELELAQVLRKPWDTAELKATIAWFLRSRPGQLEPMRDAVLGVVA